MTHLRHLRERKNIGRRAATDKLDEEVLSDDGIGGSCTQDTE